ncbi:MAG: lytic transglycosylase domain-containing protein [Candidatus Dadabacteria bacterium]|nr:lytic transglycosylase domain-containing protein [Candidatus Dadabacteria bacterium]NIS07948.1 lytic transglycosylase domain-containing protein [Candidatus Dadabacteria bacterium]NIV43041.1 transglycosylase SLT domain-containing protein [Candidatus Dadabacteria bacterium]NIX14904.1 transglycosylase SLT domain-containing protein [Candidatus Dadabacteria bacterium]NIY21532.1 transglycosylase SLT domain-containing protein [Candidatus Dadabacteria bacterium]
MQRMMGSVVSFMLWRFCIKHLMLFLLLSCIFTSYGYTQSYYYKKQGDTVVYTNLQPSSGGFKTLKTPWGKTRKKKINYGSTRYSDGYNKEIIRAAHKYSLDPNIIKAIIKIESNFDPKAVSRKGAMGLMQLMPQTALGLGVSNPFNPAQNIQGGTKYFRKLMNMFSGNIKLALAGYNAGENAVIKYGYTIPPYNETENYVEKVLYHYNNLKGNNSYNYNTGEKSSLVVKSSDSQNYKSSDVYDEEQLRDEYAGKFLIQLASYPKLALAKELKYTLKSKGYPAFIQKAYLPNSGTWYRVRIGSFTTKDEARQFKDSLKTTEPFLNDAIVVNL